MKGLWNGMWVVAGAVAIALATTGSGAAQGTGSVTGVVTASAVKLAPIRVTIDPRVCGDALPDESILVGAKGGLANAVVTLAGVKGRPNPGDITIVNEGCRFVPRVQVVRPKALVHATSKDPMLHTTQALTPAGVTLFNLALPVPGLTIARPLSDPGIVRIACNIHQWMRGWVIVTDEVAAVTGPDGTFTLPDVPPGTYELHVWHESLKGASQKVTVAAGKAAAVTIAMK